MPPAGHSKNRQRAASGPIRPGTPDTTTAKITVESAGRSAALDLQTVGEVAPMLEQILKVGDDD